MAKIRHKKKTLLWPVEIFWRSPLVDDRQRETIKISKTLPAQPNPPFLQIWEKKQTNSGGENFQEDLKYVGAAASASSRRNLVFNKSRLVQQVSSSGSAKWSCQHQERSAKKENFDYNVKYGSFLHLSQVCITPRSIECIVLYMSCAQDKTWVCLVYLPCRDTDGTRCGCFLDGDIV